MTAFLGGQRVQYFKTGTSDFLEGGKVYTYVAGSLTPKATYPTYADALASTNANDNPVVLDSRGEATIVLKGATKVILKDANDVPIWTTDNLDSDSINIIDSNGNDVLKFSSVANAQNEVTIINAISGDSPKITVTGDDTNPGLSISSKGTGTIDLGTTSTGNINLLRNTVASGTLAVTGAQTNASSLSVDDALTAQTLRVVGAAAFNTTLSVAGTATFSGAVNASGALNFLPAGSVIWKASTNLPTGWLECDGSAVSRTTYAALFADIGTIYGVGNGTTTFTLPVQARRVLVGRGGAGTSTLGSSLGVTGGSETHPLVETEMPTHSHPYSVASGTTLASTGAGLAAYTSTSSTSTSNTGGGQAHNNMQPSLVMMMIIRAA
jgi:microcystin-dependent protein